MDRKKIALHGFTRTNFAFQKNSNGFTLAELMIVIVLIAILAIFALLAFQRQTIRGYDAKRKADLSQLRVVLEDFYNDKEHYPTMADWDLYNNSKSGTLLKYLQGVNTVDAVTKDPYLYITVDELGQSDPGITNPNKYKLFASLGNLQDLDILSSGCSPNPDIGCAYFFDSVKCPKCAAKYNYGISVGGVIANPTFDFMAPTPTPVPEFTIGDNFCLGEPNATHACNTKAGMVAPDGRSCSEVLRELGCTSFYIGSTCSSKCTSNYDKYKCQETESLRCAVR